MRLLIRLIPLIAIALAARLAMATCDPVTVSGDMGDPRTVVVQNGLAKLTYDELVTGRTAAHSLFVKNAGGSWVRVTDPTYGDWAYWGTTLVTECSVQFEAASPDEVTHLYACPNHDTGLGVVTYRKRVTMRRCQPGYHVRIWSEPDAGGEREIGPASPTSAVFSEVGACHHGTTGHLCIPGHGVASNWSASYDFTTGVLGVLATSGYQQAKSYVFPNQPPRLIIHTIRDATGYTTFIGGQVIAPSNNLVAAFGGQTVNDITALDGSYQLLRDTWGVTGSLSGRAGFMRYRDPKGATVSVNGALLQLPPSDSWSWVRLPGDALGAITITGMAISIEGTHIDAFLSLPAAEARAIAKQALQ